MCTKRLSEASIKKTGSARSSLKIKKNHFVVMLCQNFIASSWGFIAQNIGNAF